MLAISQSGASPDLLAALEAFPPPARWALTNVDGSPLEDAAAARIPMGAGPEESVAATKSFACSLLQIQALARALAGKAAPDPARAAEAAAAGLAAPLDLAPLAEAASAYVIGRGVTLCLAQEAADQAQGALRPARRGDQRGRGDARAQGPGGPAAAGAGPGGGRSRRPGGRRPARPSPSSAARSRWRGRWRRDGFCGLLRLLGGLYPAVRELALARGLDPDRPRALTKVTKTS